MIFSPRRSLLLRPISSENSPQISQRSTFGPYGFPIASSCVLFGLQYGCSTFPPSNYLRMHGRGSSLAPGSSTRQQPRRSSRRQKPEARLPRSLRSRPPETLSMARSKSDTTDVSTSGEKVTTDGSPSCAAFQGALTFATDIGHRA